ncbi:DUF445 domain-containing protein [Desulfosporosinus sp. BICA1-9]|uniref:DUF445 domain-containing protein n=1 Tax=Desulfosporosinus sp. BICA1-9 TaxID=1531958 RepID=UPI00054B682E|nr:DUF445 domain-containing protein [Desulfosporosinus sp. BICA1-9]KJS46510.1 MAG: membrane protein [Peptococcaceae bacterium BRH_c23]KJS78867.1 MAG: membrane protein [Desulfosporosinus sp. BICA1-9]HBW38877.1 DUF445 domain-containing protein [Desulfosporosinus sp.]
MTKRNNTQSANLTLGGITLGFLVSYPFHGSFIGGLISSGCSAGMIGGLADWFAVTALFRRPLGIRPGKVVRTEIIPQNRERIFTALADMVQHELLSKDVLRRKLSVWDFSEVLIRIIAEPDVRKTIYHLLANLEKDLTNQPETEASNPKFQGLLQENLSSLKLAQTLAEVLEFSLEHSDVDQVLKIICQTIDQYLDQPVIKVALITMIEAALARYGEDNPARKMVGKFLPSPYVLAQGLQDKVKLLLQDGNVESWLKAFLQSFVLELKTKPSLQNDINRIIYKVLNKTGTSTPNSSLTHSILRRFLNELGDNWDCYLGKFEQNKELRIKVDERVKQIIEIQIGFHHHAIGRLVREGLDPLTDDKLVKLIEEKAGNDLQMIRINGSVVGGLVGMLIYVLGMVFRS